MSRIEEIEARLNAVEEPVGDKPLWKLEREHKTLMEHAPTDLRYLLDFAKAAAEALNLALPVLRADQPPTITELDKAREALALLNGGAR